MPAFVFPRCQPEEQGVSSQGIVDFLDAVERQNLGLHSLMILRRGSVLAEGWWRPYTAHRPHMLFSLSKSFTSTAIGLAVQEGVLSLDDQVISFFPDRVTPEIRDNMETLRIRHLLTMSTGHDRDTMESIRRDPDGDWVRGFLRDPIVHEPGAHFLYNTGATYMLSAILQTVTGQTLLEYLGPRLLEPLEIADATWESCPRGIHIGGFGLSIRTEDIARFGELYRLGGLWNGCRIVPAEWIEEATRSHIANGDDPQSDWAQGYGYQFWRCRHGCYRGDGAFGQFCIVMPGQEAVVAITSGVANMQAVLDLVWTHLQPAMADPGSTEASPAAASHRLQDRLNNLTLPVPKAGAIHPASSLSGRWYDFEDNTLALQALKIEFHEKRFEVTFAVSGGHTTLSGGYGQWLEGDTTFFAPQNRSTPVAVQGVWQDASTFVMTICYTKTPFVSTLSMAIGDTSLELHTSYNASFNPADHTHHLRGIPRSDGGYERR